ncbi:MAG: histidine kinase, partial [Bacteroidota bacterium]
RRSLEYSEQEIISLEEEVEFLRNYMDINAKLRFGDRLDYAMYVDDELEEDIIGVPTMIIQPYVENSIEHGLRPKEDGLIEIRFELCEEDDDMILCIIEDNGVGRKRASELQQASIKHQGHKSMGTKITETRLQLLHQGDEADFEFVKIIDLEDEEDKTPLGTRVEVRIPILDLQVK